MAYEVIILYHLHMPWYDVETLQGFTLNTHSGTGIQYLVKDGEEGRGGKVLLQNEADRKGDQTNAGS